MKRKFKFFGIASIVVLAAWAFTCGVSMPLRQEAALDL